MEYCEDEELLENKEKEKKKLRKILIITAVVIGILFLLFYSVYKFAVPVDYRHFNEKRIRQIEEEYRISLDNAEPERYWKPRLAQDTISCFNFYTDDYRAFMDSFHGESIEKSYEEEDGSHANYKCRVDGKYYFTVDFTRESGRYKGKLSYYRDNISNADPAQTTTANGIRYSIISVDVQ